MRKMRKLKHIIFLEHSYIWRNLEKIGQNLAANFSGFSTFCLAPFEIEAEQSASL
jgi:hypothetical protein